CRCGAVEALAEGMLRGLAGRDVVPFDPAFLLPSQDRDRGQLAAIVADDQLWVTAASGDCVQFAGDPHPRQRRVRDQAKTFPGEVVDDGQDAEATAVAQGIGQEVQRPALIDPLRQYHWSPRPQCPLAAAPPALSAPLRQYHWSPRPRCPLAAAPTAHRQPLFPISPV